MTSGQKRFPVAPSRYAFEKCGQSGIEISELLPHLKGVADEMTMIKSVHTEAINHDPACTFVMTGSEVPGKPSLGSWISYGLGSESEDLPAFVVLTPTFPKGSNAQALFTRMWSSGFLPTKYDGVALRGQGDPVLYVQNPPGVNPGDRRAMLNALNKLNERTHQRLGDPETQARIAQYEMAFRMQTSVPELTDLKGESKETLEMYGPEVERAGSYAHSAIMARRLAGRRVTARLALAGTTLTATAGAGQRHRSRVGHEAVPHGEPAGVGNGDALALLELDGEHPEGEGALPDPLQQPRVPSEAGDLFVYGAGLLLLEGPRRRSSVRRSNRRSPRPGRPRRPGGGSAPPAPSRCH